MDAVYSLDGISVRTLADVFSGSMLQVVSVEDHNLAVLEDNIPRIRGDLPSDGISLRGPFQAIVGSHEAPCSSR
jgi:hypothetical protein